MQHCSAIAVHAAAQPQLSSTSQASSNRLAVLLTKQADLKETERVKEEDLHNEEALAFQLSVAQQNAAALGGGHRIGPPPPRGISAKHKDVQPNRYEKKSCLRS